MTTTRASSKRTAAQESSTQTPVASQPQAKTPQQKKSQASAKKAQTKPTSKPEPEPQLQSEAIPQASPPTTRSRKRKADIGSRTDKTTRPARGRAVRFVEDKPKSEETSGKVPAPSKCDDTESVEQSNLSNKPDETVAEKTDDQEDETVKQRQYFLIKSEPESRMQDGHDMKFSIDDLIAEDQSTAHWDGVRNYEARNVIKEMRLGDRAFFYHSNSRKDRPSIVGEVEIVKEAYPDHTAFDKDDPHYDPKSEKDSPRWFMVDVKFVRKLAKPVTLDDIKAEPKLSQMQLVKRGRISVQRVTPDEWSTVLAMSETDTQEK